MKVALVHSYYSSQQPSGENVVVDSQAEALRDHGVEVLVVAARTDELENRTGYKYRAAVNVATGHGPSPVAALREFAPDIVHVHNLFPNWGTAWLNEWAGPLVATVHNFRPVCASGTLFRDGAGCTLCPDTNSSHSVRHACYRGSAMATLPLAIRNWGGVDSDRLLSRADRIVLLSPRAARLYAGFGLSPDKSTIIPNFVSDVGFSPTEAPGTGWIYIGRLTAEKGILNLLKHWPDSETLRIYGDGPLRPQVEALVGTNIAYMGQLSHEEIPKVLAQSRGLVFPSEWAEGLPMVYAEALAGGRAVVAKSGNSAADDVRISGAGEVFDTWPDIGRALKQVAANDQDLGTCARKHFERMYSREIWLEKTVELYESVRKPGAPL